MAPRSVNRGGWSTRGIIAVISCLFGLGLVFFGFGAGTESPQQETPAGSSPVAQAQRKRPVRVWNMALGDVVLVAQELGFGVKPVKESDLDQGKIAARIDSQLQSLRDLYRQEGEKKPTLMGGMMLQLSIGASGEVTQVKELASRIADVEFKKAIIAEASKWSFAELVSENVTVNCPLLFVREGMDITTLVQWERSLGQLGDKGALGRGSVNGTPVQQSRVTETPKPPENGFAALANAAQKSAPRQAVTPPSAAYQIRYATSVRKEPNFSAAVLTRFTSGTKISVINNRGEWLEVRVPDTGQSGFIRKEFVGPVELAGKQ